MRQIASDNIVQMEKKASNKFGLFLVFLAVVAIFGGGGYLVYRYRDKIDWDIKLPWETSSTKKEEKDNKDKTNNKKNNRELVVPYSKESIREGNTTLSIKEITADDRGYLITFELLTNAKFANLTVDEILIDSFYTGATLEISDAFDSSGTQEGTTKKVRIDQTELDKFQINGFSRMNLFLTIEEAGSEPKHMMKVMSFNNETAYQAGNKGLIKVDEKGGVLIEYHKVVKDSDETYIYFEAKNSDLNNKKEILIKKLMVNDRIYEMPKYQETLYPGARQSFYIKIPKKKIKDVENFLVSFYIIDKGETEIYNGIYITNEYSKTI